MSVMDARHPYPDWEFRDALGLFATGVAVITTVTADGERVGTTVSSFNSVSLDPPLVLFSIARSANAFPVWRSARFFAVNVLDERQSSVSNRFAKSLTDKWTGIETIMGKTRIPILAQALAWFECERYAGYDGGDHLIIVGRVLAVQITNRADRLPLVFFRSKYRRLDDENKIDTPLDADHWLHGW
jgi:flavin reductase (DIM6/NTAB) family NADH-FMN oxidoreductase RutF